MRTSKHKYIKIMQFSHRHSFQMCHCPEVDIICTIMFIFLSTVFFILNYLSKYPVITILMCVEDQCYPSPFAWMSYFNADRPCCFTSWGITSEAHLVTDSDWLVTDWQVTACSSGHSEELQSVLFSRATQHKMRSPSAFSHAVTVTLSCRDTDSPSFR